MKNGPNRPDLDRPPLDPGMPWTSTAEFVAYKFRWLKQVIQHHRRLHKVALTVAVGLVDFFNYDSGEAFPKNVTLGKAVNLSERSVGTAIQALRDDHHLLQVGWRGYRNRIPSFAMQFRGVATEETCAESGTLYAGLEPAESGTQSSGLKPAESGTQSPFNSEPRVPTEHVPTEHVSFPPSSEQVAARARAYDAEAEAAQVRQERAANEERKRLPETTPGRSKHGTRALADLAHRKGRTVPPPPPEMKPEPEVRTIGADQVAAVITDRPIPPTAIDITPEAATLTPLVGEPVSPEWDACLQLATEWGGINLDRAVQLVTAMTAELSIERMHDHFSRISKLHRSGRTRVELIRRAIATEVAALAQPDLFAPSPWSASLGATSPPAGAALAPTATLFDLAALRQCAAQIAEWRPDLDGPNAQRVAREWMTAAGVKRLGLLFEKVAPRKRSGAAKSADAGQARCRPKRRPRSQR